jgi:hypothetical protein
MATFNQLTIGPSAAESLALLYRIAQPVYECIRAELRRMLTEDFDRRELLPDILEPRFHGFDCCQMTLLVSVKGDQVHVAGLVPARNQLRGILP